MISIYVENMKKISSENYVYNVNIIRSNFSSQKICHQNNGKIHKEPPSLFHKSSPVKICRMRSRVLLTKVAIVSPKGNSLLINAGLKRGRVSTTTLIGVA